MFDTLKSIWAGFCGKLRSTKEARKLVWLLLVAFLAGWLATSFAAWVSFPSYRGMIEYLPFANPVAWFFTLGIAGFLYFALAYLSGFFVEKWKGVAAPNYTALGARIFGVCAVVFLVVDLYMNYQGTSHRASEAAGHRVEASTYQTAPTIADNLRKDRVTLAELRAGKIGGYGWRNPKDKIFHLNQSGKKYQRELSASIRRNELADSTARAAFLADVQAKNEDRDQIEQRAAKTLKNGVYGVYVLVLLLCIVQAYIVETIQEATGQNAVASIPANRARVKPSKQKSSVTPIPTAPTPQKAIRAAGGGWEIQCKHCGDTAVMKSHLAKYCSDECRVEAWEMRTGAKVKKGNQKRRTKIGF